VRFRGTFAYVSGQLHDDEILPLCRLRYGGSAARWGFAVYLASKDGYEDPSSPPVALPAPPRTPWTAPATSTSPALTSDRRQRASPQTHSNLNLDELPEATTVDDPVLCRQPEIRRWPRVTA
jgi:hypothetical protein